LLDAGAIEFCLLMWRQSRRLTSHTAFDFFRAATIAFNVQFFYHAMTEFLLFIY